MQARLASTDYIAEENQDLLISSLYFPSAGMTGVHLHAQFLWVFNKQPILAFQGVLIPSPGKPNYKFYQTRKSFINTKCFSYCSLYLQKSIIVHNISLLNILSPRQIHFLQLGGKNNSQLFKKQNPWKQLYFVWGLIRKNILTVSLERQVKHNGFYFVLISGFTVVKIQTS